MLNQVRDPKLDGVKLTQTDNEVLQTRLGWAVTSFVAKDGDVYEKAQRRGVVKWFKLTFELEY